MQTVLPFSRMSEAAERMDPKVLAYLNEGQIETFESFETFSIIAFDWYDVHSARTADSQMLLYLRTGRICCSSARMTRRRRRPVPSWRN
ncbi:MAG: hypothetical protein V8R40_06595 [Dysosmobacter sp.]